MSAANAQTNWPNIPLRYVCELSPPISFAGMADEDEITFLPMEKIKKGRFTQNIDKFSKYTPSYNAFEEGDILLAKVTPCFENGNIAIAQNLVGGRGFGSSELFVVRPTKVNRKFLFYYFQSSGFKQLGEASMTGAGGLKRVSPDLLRQHHLPLPSAETQCLIADYLDQEAARIDDLIAEKERMRVLLGEKRAALISGLVTRGLDHDTPMKQSGQKWLGEIPAHWNLLRLKFLVESIDQGASPQCFSYPAEPGGWGVLKTGCVNSGIFRETENKALPIEIEPSITHEAQVNDVLMSRASGSVDLIGSVAYITSQPKARLLLSDKIYRFQLKDELIDPAFMVLAMGSGYLRHQIKSVISGAEGLANNIAKSDILEFLIIVPPLQEQRKIDAYLRNKLAKNAALCEALTESIALAKERRSALITAAVTGQIPLAEMASPAGGSSCASTV